MKNLTILTIMIAFLFSCGGTGISKLPKGKGNYAGVWTSGEIYLSIGENGQVNYEKHSGSSKTTINAPIQEFKGNNFTVGVLGINTDFIVSKPPHDENGTWKMTVDGQELTRQQ